MNKIIGIIPARYASQRLKAKALADIGGLPMVIRI
jgi:CMP-2-keto-3-deoxyoctulosonic acid synthetase